jgi:hypothetical protein
VVIERTYFFLCLIVRSIIVFQSIADIAGLFTVEANPAFTVRVVEDVLRGFNVC